MYVSTYVPTYVRMYVRMYMYLIPLCRWLEAVLGEELPPATELEDALQNGVYLCRLTMIFQPDEDIGKKVYDLDQSKFKVLYVLYACMHGRGHGTYVCTYV